MEFDEQGVLDGSKVDDEPILDPSTTKTNKPGKQGKLLETEHVRNVMPVLAVS